jgi:fumarate hydratase class I
VKALSYPFVEPAVRALVAGEAVSLTGLVFTGRDRLHKFLHEGGQAPVSFRDGAIFHCGPVVVQEQDGSWRVVAAGPTTSSREDPYMPGIVARLGVRVIIGKGGMSAATSAACREHGCVYLQAVGGAAVSIADRIRRVRGVHFLQEFGATEALWELELAGLETVVAMDASGNSLYDEVAKTSRANLARLLHETS